MSTLPPSSLSVPISQNTAPVIKFRCLYTYDLRRKAKRWQDGYLRFHTFNKRVMVYDTPGTFVGDLHWRQEAEIQDGDELELDKGVLIQVCERMERTETDLSKLYERKNPTGSPRPAQSFTQSPRASTPLQPSQPSNPRRSLNDLLGIKRTPIGSLAAPYEERHTLAQREQNSSERAPKRQKLLPEKKQQEKRARPSNPSEPVVIDLVESSTPESAPAPRQPSKSVTTPRRNFNPERSGTHVPSSHAETRSLPTTIQQKHDNPQSSSKSTAPSTSPEIQNNQTPNTPVNILRLSAAKPRKKLMYTALLPTQPPKSSAVQTSAKSSARAPLPETRSQKVENNPRDHLLTEFAPSASTQFALDEIIEVEPSQLNKAEQNNKLTTHLPQAGRSVPIPPPALAHDTPVDTTSSKKSQKDLRKSFSDPSALTTVAGIQCRRYPGHSPLSTLVDESRANDQGPWTPEALDLFDFWPPGRQKPS